MDPKPPSQPPATATAEAPPPENLDNATHSPPDEMHNPQGRAVANFKAFVMAIAASDPKRPLTPPLKALIENRFHHFFDDCHTPHHPTYAAMTITALKELREEGGSSEDSISEFIKSKYDDLPRAHSTFLKLHLWKLCESGDIDVTHEKRYLLGDAITKLSPGQNTGGWTKRGKPEEKRDRPCMEGTIEEENETKETARTESEIREQQQQEQERPYPRKLVVRLRPPMPESASLANVSESLPLDHCHDQKAAFMKLSPTKQQSQNEQQQPVKRRRGRPPKLSIQVGEGHERWTQEFNRDMKDRYPGEHLRRNSITIYYSSASI